MLKALEAPIKQIAFNAGLEGSVIIDKIVNSGKVNDSALMLITRPIPI